MGSGRGGGGGGGIAPPSLTPQQFVEDFPAFENAATFPPSSIKFWITAGGLLLNMRRFGTTYTLALELFVAHNVALEAFNQQAADAGGIPGLSRGVITGESGVDVSASYDSGAASVPDAGHWNLTTYGTRLKWLINMFGAGPIYVGPGGFCDRGFFNVITGGVPFGPGWFAEGNTALFEGNI